MMNYLKKIFICSIACCSFSTWAANPPESRLVDKTVAIVNQDIILYSEYQDFKKGMEIELEKDSKNQDAKGSNNFDRKVLDQMIEDKLLEQEIKILGLEATDSQVENVVGEVMKNNGLQTKRDLERALKGEGITYDEFIAQYKKRIARSNLVNQVIRPKIKISDDQIDTEYKKRNPAEKNMTEYDVLMIFLSKNSTTLPQMEKLQKSIHSVDDFAKAANSVTEGPGKGSDGSLGWINPSDLQEPLSSTILKMKKDDVSQVLQTDTGYYILACRNEKITKSEKNEKIRDEIQDDLVNKQLVMNLNQYIMDLKRKSHIEVYL